MYVDMKSNFLTSIHEEDYLLNLDALDNAGGSSSVRDVHNNISIFNTISLSYDHVFKLCLLYIIIISFLVDPSHSTPTARRLRRHSRNINVDRYVQQNGGDRSSHHMPLV